MGCPHYQRKCKLQAACCGGIFGCRFCHDEQSDHAIVRTDTKTMYCMLCQRLQPAGATCVGCDETMARYYCDKCKLWDDVPGKAVYHCDDCGMCRQGQGLGKDFFHCATCHICMSISMQHKHRCIERNLESDCPICGEYMFTSTATVIFMPCGHCIHKHCYADYIQTSYQCPTCMKSLGDMSHYFARLDRALERQSMPDEYAHVLSHVFCNDCERRCAAPYHFFYHKCAHCASYNTTVLRTEKTESPPPSCATIMEHAASDPSSSDASSSSSPSPPRPTSPEAAFDPDNDPHVLASPSLEASIPSE
ncbi:zinc-ribbon-domain-containing protein [Absidia repens]|uniref:Zinc-ribbon-domain-containing protein n=1 Tax=Absidia repens TaxID=90262 RepID=A0A1X2HYP6_9FUNG|nr:zinc-ribbon-domain-containing protein [Absidia repens]